MILFYSNLISGNTAVLEAEEFHHCFKVLRHQEGDTIHISDGKGKQAIAQISKIRKREAELIVESISEAKPKTSITTIAVAPPKYMARWEWLIEKTVEIGVDRLIPLVTAHTERPKVNVERSEKILRSAAMQSLRPFHPSLSPLTNFKALMAELHVDTDCYLAHYSDSNPFLTKLERKNPNSIILIGPEGDFTKEEMEIAISKGFVECNISSHRLRTETAAMVSMSMIKSMGY